MKTTIDQANSVIPNIPHHYSQHPRFKLLKSLPHAPEHPTRIKILEFRESGVVDVDIANLTQLKAYWTKKQIHPPCKGRLYLAEDISLPYIAALEQHFTIDPHFFVEYVKLDPDRTQNFLEGYHTMRRIASLRPRLNFATFVYHEIRTFDVSAPRREEYEILTRTNVPRLVTTVNHRRTQFTGLVRRNLSVWWRKQESKSSVTNGDEHEAWDAIILVDAGMSDRLMIRPWSAPTWRTTTAVNTAYLDGYLDFSEWPTTNITQKDRASPSTPSLSPFSNTYPPTHNMLDDITTYWKQTSSSPSRTSPDLTHALSDPRYAPIIAHRILCSHWNLQLEYLVSVVSDLEKGLLRFEQMDAHPGAESINNEVRALRVLLSDVNSWRRRVYFYLEQVRWNAEVLGVGVETWGAHECRYEEGREGVNGHAYDGHADIKIPTCTLSPNTAAHLTSTDLTTHLHTLRLLQQRIQSLLPTVMGAFTLLEAQRSVLRADLTIRLSGVALVFVPLSFSASLLSMSEDYVPGKGRFWVYFAISGPLVVGLWWWAFWGQGWKGWRDGVMMGERKRVGVREE